MRKKDAKEEAIDLERFGETEARAEVREPRDSRCREGRDNRKKLKLEGKQQARVAHRGVSRRRPGNRKPDTVIGILLPNKPLGRSATRRDEWDSKFGFRRFELDFDAYSEMGHLSACGGTVPAGSRRSDVVYSWAVCVCTIYLESSCFGVP